MLKEAARPRIQNGCCQRSSHLVFAVFDGPLQEAGETALHYSVRTADQTSLHLVDFLVQNRYIPQQSLRRKKLANNYINTRIDTDLSREPNRCRFFLKCISDYENKMWYISLFLSTNITRIILFVCSESFLALQLVVKQWKADES